LISREYSIVEAAKVVHVSRVTVYNWLLLIMAEGFNWLTGLNYQGRGRKPKLNKQQKAHLYQIIVAGPECYGFTCGVWTSSMIAEVIMKEFNVVYNVRYISYLLKKMGLTYQKAAFESDHLDEEKRKEWVEKKWPRILKAIPVNEIKKNFINYLIIYYSIVYHR
jgi:transposase